MPFRRKIGRKSNPMPSPTLDFFSISCQAFHPYLWFVSKQTRPERHSPMPGSCSGPRNVSGNGCRKPSMVHCFFYDTIFLTYLNSKRGERFIIAFLVHIKTFIDDLHLCWHVQTFIDDLHLCWYIQTLFFFFIRDYCFFHDTIFIPTRRFLLTFLHSKGKRIERVWSLPLYYQCSASDWKSSMKNEWAYCDYIFSNLYMTHNSYGPMVLPTRPFLLLRHDFFWHIWIRNVWSLLSWCISRYSTVLIRSNILFHTRPFLFLRHHFHSYELISSSTRRFPFLREDFFRRSWKGKRGERLITFKHLL